MSRLCKTQSKDYEISQFCGSHHHSDRLQLISHANTWSSRKEKINYKAIFEHDAKISPITLVFSGSDRNISKLSTGIYNALAIDSKIIVGKKQGTKAKLKFHWKQLIATAIAMSRSTLSDHLASFEWVSLEWSSNSSVDELWIEETVRFAKFISFPPTPNDDNRPWKRNNYFQNPVLHTRERRSEGFPRSSSTRVNYCIASSPREITVITRMVSMIDCTFLSSRIDGNGRRISSMGTSWISSINAEWIDVGSLHGWWSPHAGLPFSVLTNGELIVLPTREIVPSVTETFVKK